MKLALTKLTEELQHAAIGHTIEWHEQIPSTMPRAHELAAQPATRSGTLVVAEEQTAGRGRYQRKWEAPGGEALLLSLILKPPLGFDLAELAIRTAVGIAQALESSTPALIDHVGIKWPNDILLGSAIGQPAGKVAGILIESQWQAGTLDHVVVGIGLNVNQSQQTLAAQIGGALPPVSLRSFLQQEAEFDRTALLITLCNSLGAVYSQTDSNLSFAAWQQRLWMLGRPIALYQAESLVWQGVATEVNQAGALCVAAPNGEKRWFLAGEVSVRFS